MMQEKILDKNVKKERSFFVRFNCEAAEEDFVDSFNGLRQRDSSLTLSYVDGCYEAVDISGVSTPWEILLHKVWNLSRGDEKIAEISNIHI